MNHFSKIINNFINFLDKYSKPILKLFVIICILTCYSTILTAQNLLKIEDAVSIGLKNNFDIQIASNEANITKVNNTAGNAGMLPNLNLNLGANYAINNAYLEYSNGSIVNKAAAAVQNYNAGIALNWTIFDGFKMFTTKQKFEEIERLGELKYRSQVQQTVSQIIEGYYNIVKQKQQLNTILEVKALSAERMKLGETRFNSGFSAKTEFLQAQIDFNTQYQNEVLQKDVIEESKRNLNKLINRDISEIFDVDLTIPVGKIDSSDAINKIFKLNPDIQILNKQVEIARLSIDEFQSLNLPFVNFSAGYLINLAENSAGQVTFNRGYGPQVGATLSLPIYQGGNISRLVQSSELSLNSLQLQLASVKSDLITQFHNAFNQYKTQQKLLEIEEKTTELAKENLYLSMERLKLSQTTSIEVRDAQLSYENSLTRRSNIHYNLKIAETQIKLLMGEL